VSFCKEWRLCLHMASINAQRCPSAYQPQLSLCAVETVVQRILYKADRHWDGKIRLADWRRCGIVKVLRQLERQLDINEVSISEMQIRS
jgi:hypothetical protein